MKKAILSSLFVIVSLVSFAQSTIKGQAQTQDDIKKYIPSQDKKFVIAFSANEFDFLLACAQFGFQPYVKTTTIPMNQIETLQQSYGQLLKDKFDQFKKQYVADSLAHSQPNH